MQQTICDNCGGDITHNAIDTVDCMTGPLAFTPVHFSVKVEHVDICMACLIECLQKHVTATSTR